jgi:hypothetical protein
MDCQAKDGCDVYFSPGFGLDAGPVRMSVNSQEPE